MITILKTILIIILIIVGFWFCYAACVVASGVDRYSDHYETERKKKHGRKL